MLEEIATDDHVDDYDGMIDRQRALEMISSILSSKEQEVLRLKSDGYTYSEIATITHVTPKSAEGTMRRLRKKVMECFPDLAETYREELIHNAA